MSEHRKKLLARYAETSICRDYYGVIVFETDGTLTQLNHEEALQRFGKSTVRCRSCGNWTKYPGPCCDNCWQRLRDELDEAGYFDDE